MTDNKVSIRFFEDREVRAIWDDDNTKWWFSVLDVVGVLNQQDDYEKNRNYWKYLKTKLKKEEIEVVSATNQLKMVAPDGKRRLTDVLDSEGVIRLAKSFPFAEKMATATAEISQLLSKGHELEDEIRKQLKSISYEI